MENTAHTLTCYHGHELTVNEMLGIVSYSHPNGDSCQHMNRLDASVDDLLASVIRCHGISGSPPRPDVISAISCSKQARYIVYKMMSQATRVILPTMIRDYYGIVGLISLQSNYEIITELMSVFGAPMVQNIIKVIGIDCSSMLKHSNSDRLPVIELTDKDVRAAAERERAERANKKTTSEPVINKYKNSNLSEKEFDDMMNSKKTIEQEVDDNDDDDEAW